MLKQIMDYLKTNRRSIRKNIRSNYTRPIKDYLNYKYIVWMIMFHNFNKILFKLKNLRFIGFAFILFWLLRDFAFAADNATEWMNTVIEFLNWLIYIVLLIAQPLVMFVWWLLSPDWTFGDVIWLRNILHKMWILVSNVVYVIFAFLLIAIAFLNVFKENSNMSIKTALPRLIIWILIVPFTWFIVSTTLSVTNILTASVMRLPFDTVSFQKPELLDKIKIPKIIIMDLTESNSWSTEKVSAWTYWEWEGADEMTLTQLLESNKWAYNILPFYAYWIFKIQDLKIIESKQKDTIKKIWDIFKKLAFWTIFALVFAVLIIALAFALLSRMVRLWLYAMFSPLFAISFFFSWSVKWWKISEDLKKHFSIGKFISLAMVPVYVAAALSFWLMFLWLAMSVSSNPNTNLVEYWKCEKAEWEDCQYITSWWFELQIWWNYQTDKMIEWWNNLMNTWAWMISNIIIYFIALAVLWMAVMAALNANEITKWAVEPFTKMGTDIWWLIKSMPKYTPIPMPGWKSISAAWLWNLTWQIKQTIDTRALWDSSEIWQKFGWVLADRMWLPINELSKAISSMGKNLTSEEFMLAKAAVGDFNKKEKAIKSYMWDMWWLSAKQIIEQQKTREKLVEWIQQMYGLSNEDVKWLISTSRVEEFNIAFQNLAKKNKITTFIDENNISQYIWTKSSESPTNPVKPNNVTYSWNIIKKDDNKNSLEIKLNVDWVEKNIKLENSTMISAKSIVLDTNDKSEFKWLLTWSETKDKQLFIKIFWDDVWKKVYDEIIK